MSDKVQLELGSEFDDSNYKSCFARSVAVNSQYKQLKTADMSDKKIRKENNKCEVFRKSAPQPMSLDSQNEIVRFRKNLRSSSIDETRRLSCGSLSASRRSSICSNRISEIPVENIVNQSKIETLQWQLKEIEKSREMYRAVMKQVVAFLEKTHHSLELLGNRLNTKNSVPRSKSEHQIVSQNNTLEKDSTLTPGISCIDDYVSYKDFTWRRQKKQDVPSEEVPPEKLAKEAFRLLRTAQSLLNTQEPKLAPITSDPENDIEFLAQLAKEFPQTPEHKPHRATSFSLSPKLILPENETKLSTTLNRKLSLQLNENRRHSTPKLIRNVDSARGSVAESETDILSPINDFNKDHRSSLISHSFFTQTKAKEPEKSNSPATGSISSVEDESGFSSMNSFQDVGLPLVNSSTYEEVSTKNALLRSMLHNNSDYSSLSIMNESNSIIENTILPRSNDLEKQDSIDKRRTIDEIKLWQKPSTTTNNADIVNNIAHKRWHSNPVDDSSNIKTNQSMKVLWV